MPRAALLFALASMLGFAQDRQAPAKPAAIAMPADRTADSYSIYSSLMPLGETADKGWPHDLWLVQDTTVTVVAPNEPCNPGPPPDHRVLGMNPHVAVHPTSNLQQDFVEILEDFDLHCHDRLTLDRNAWTGLVPVHLLNGNEQETFRKSRFDGTPAPEFKGAPALYGFSEVYFNAKHTVALVYATHWCGALCGEGFWLGLTLQDGKWKRAQWLDSASWIS